jgi:hypothetical protein
MSRRGACAAEQGQAQYQNDHDDDLTKSNSVVFNTFIFMQVSSACSQLNTMK